MFNLGIACLYNRLYLLDLEPNEPKLIKLKYEDYLLWEDEDDILPFIDAVKNHLQVNKLRRGKVKIVYDSNCVSKRMLSELICEMEEDVCVDMLSLGGIVSALSLEKETCIINVLGVSYSVRKYTKELEVVYTELPAEKNVKPQELFGNFVKESTTSPKKRPDFVQYFETVSFIKMLLTSEQSKSGKEYITARREISRLLKLNENTHDLQLLNRIILVKILIAQGDAVYEVKPPKLLKEADRYLQGQYELSIRNETDKNIEDMTKKLSGEYGGYEKEINGIVRRMIPVNALRNIKYLNKVIEEFNRDSVKDRISKYKYFQ